MTDDRGAMDLARVSVLQVTLCDTREGLRGVWLAAGVRSFDRGSTLARIFPASAVTSTVLTVRASSVPASSTPKGHPFRVSLRRVVT